MEGKSRGSVLSISYFSSLSVWGGIDILSELMGFETKGVGMAHFVVKRGNGPVSKNCFGVLGKERGRLKRHSGLAAAATQSPPFDPKTRTKRELAFLLSQPTRTTFFIFVPPISGKIVCRPLPPLAFPSILWGFISGQLRAAYYYNFPSPPITVRTNSALRDLMAGAMLPGKRKKEK